jgi:hypothetical protein
MPKEEREQLMREVEELRSDIESLQPAARAQEAESSRALLSTLRKALARDMERLHEDR